MARVSRRAAVTRTLARAMALCAASAAGLGVAKAQQGRLSGGGEDVRLPAQDAIGGQGGAVARSSGGASVLLPQDGRVVSGSASISGDGGRLTITQASNRAIINWASFDIGAGNSVVFAQPDAGSATLNRVTGSTGSTIAGQLSATGSVFLINPNGIVITASGTVQAGGGFVASTLDIADGDFNAGRLVFTGSGASKAVSNAGTIRVGAGGYAALLGGSVSHGGTIDVPLGRVGIGSGEQVALDLSGDGFLRVAMPTQALVGEDKALIELAGNIASAGGRVEVRAATVADAVRNVVNFTGTISADSAVGDGGTIILIGGADPQNMAGTARYSGTLSARATGAAGNGGFVETSGQDLKLDGVRVDTRAATGRTGTWLIDPVTLTVDAAAAGTIGTNLATANVTLQTTSTTASGPGVQDPTGAGDIIINSAINWTSSNSLSLLAFNNITLNAAISGPLGSLVLTAGNNVANTGAITTGTNGTVNVGLFNLTNGNWSQNSATLPAFQATDFRFDVTKASFLRAFVGSAAYGISDIYGLQGINSSNLRSQNITLLGNIDASVTARWNSGAGFVPIGSSPTSRFSGSFNGFFYIISGLTINLPNSYFVGLFGITTTTASITRVGVVDASVIGLGDTGIVAGNALGTLSDVFSSGTVRGTDAYVGGVAGATGQVPVTRLASWANVTGANSAGGLIGTSYQVSNSFAAGTVTSTGFRVGGLVGSASDTVSNSYATGAVSGVQDVGGLVGLTFRAISSSYASGRVTGSTNVGGLVGRTTSTVTNAYWDSYSTTRANAVGSGGTLTNVNPVTSDPAQAASANYAYNSSAYANLTAGTGIDTVNVSGFVFMPGNDTRPFLAFEVPSAAISSRPGSAILIYSPNQLQLIGYDATRLAGSYELARDLDLSATGAVTAGTPGSYGGMWSSAGWVPVGTQGAAFTGQFDGNFRIISGLTINRAGTDYVGTFGYASGSLTRLALVSASITGRNYVGAAVGLASSITNVYSTGRVSGNQLVGGVVGNATGDVAYLASWAQVSGSYIVGGVIGRADARVRNSFAAGPVTAASGSAGGLAGGAVNVSLSYATGAVSGGTGAAGGLIGSLSGTISSSYASGRVSGSTTGGLVGDYAPFTSQITSSYWDSYSTGQGAATGGSSSGVSASAVTSDPAQSASANYAFRASAYANLTGASGVGTTSANGFVFMPGNSTRPFLAFEVPSAAASGTGANGEILIHTPNQLQLLGYDATRLSGTYALARTLDLSATGVATVGTPGSFAGMWSTSGWVPIGSDGAGNFWKGGVLDLLNSAAGGAPYGFYGRLSGRGLSVTGLSINRGTVNNVGLFGLVSGAVSDLAIAGNVDGRNGVGGLAGLSIGAYVLGVSSSVNVRGVNNVGSLVGNLNSNPAYSMVTRSSASGSASGTANVGGLIGYASGATISRSSASGNVTGTTFYAGGLVGYLDATALSDSFATGSVGGATNVGGLIGQLNGGSVTRTYAVGAVTGSAALGGLIGRLSGSGAIAASYWNTESSGRSTSAGSGATGLTSAQFQTQTNFVGWDFTNIWTPPGTRPTLRP